MVMLTPAEELGLSGLSLDSQVRKLFYRIPGEELAALARNVEAEAYRRRLLYMREIGRAHV